MEGKAPQFVPPTRTTRDRYVPALSDRLYRLVMSFVLVPLVWGFAALGVLVVAMLLYGLGPTGELEITLTREAGKRFVVIACTAALFLAALKAIFTPRGEA